MSPEGSAISSCQDVGPGGSNSWWILCLCHFFLFTSGLRERENLLTLVPHFPHTRWPGLCWLGCEHGLLVLGGEGYDLKKQQHPFKPQI